MGPREKASQRQLEMVVRGFKNLLGLKEKRAPSISHPKFLGIWGGALGSDLREAGMA